MRVGLAGAAVTAAVMATIAATNVKVEAMVTEVSMVETRVATRAAATEGVMNRTGGAVATTDGKDTRERDDLTLLDASQTITAGLERPVSSRPCRHQ